jgi:hypothetical protein
MFPVFALNDVTGLFYYKQRISKKGEKYKV